MGLEIIFILYLWSMFFHILLLKLNNIIKNTQVVRLELSANMLATGAGPARVGGSSREKSKVHPPVGSPVSLLGKLHPNFCV